MQLVKLTTAEKTKTSYNFLLVSLVLFFTAFSPAFAQDNSPYSRYGLGDLVPPTNIANRSMGGITAGYTDYLSINFNNPASYSSFESGRELKSKKLVTGRAILDIGLNFENRTLSDPLVINKFTASNALFSYVQVGMPLRKNWGFSFGLRPISRISYKIVRNEKLINPNPPFNPIDSAFTRFEGDGGSYLASMGTGFSIYNKTKKYGLEEKLSIGFNGGYLFGRKDYKTKRTIYNDTVSYQQANYETKTNFGNLFFNTGIQYRVPLNIEKRISLTIGAYGSWGQQLNATRDILRETFTVSETLGDVRVDSVSDQKDIKGKITMPSSFTAGFVLQKYAVPNKEGGWLIGVDYEKQNWDDYRIYGQRDSVQNKWELRAGVQINPVPKKNYFSNVAYRFGFFTGPDYIRVGQKINQIGASFGMGLPMALNRQAPYQTTIINLALEYNKRGNDNNLLKENLFRFSLGFSLSDIWFVKRKYD